jgi:hypothetical protein
MNKIRETRRGESHRFPESRPLGSSYAQRLHRRHYRIGEEHGVNPLHDVVGDFEKVPFVFHTGRT